MMNQTAKSDVNIYINLNKKCNYRKNLWARLQKKYKNRSIHVLTEMYRIQSRNHIESCGICQNTLEKEKRIS